MDRESHHDHEHWHAGEITVLSAADSDRSLLARSWHQVCLALGDENCPPVRILDLSRLQTPHDWEHLCESLEHNGRLVVARLLGGAAYWKEGMRALSALIEKPQAPLLALLPGDAHPDEELVRCSTLVPNSLDILWRCLVHGGLENADLFWRRCLTLIGYAVRGGEEEPRLLPSVGVMSAPERLTSRWQGTVHFLHDHGPDPCVPRERDRVDAQQAIPPEGTGDEGEGVDGDGPDGGRVVQVGEGIVRGGGGVVWVLAYRAWVLAGDIQPVEVLCRSLEARGLTVVALFVPSLKDVLTRDLFVRIRRDAPPDAVICPLGFCVSDGGDGVADQLARLWGTDIPHLPLVFQATFASHDVDTWQSSPAGLSVRDIIMQVSLPEIDGRIQGSAVAFKHTDAPTDLVPQGLTRFVAHPDLVERLIDTVEAWIRLRRVSWGERRVAVVLANYPNRDSRVGNGVGLDTPASVLDSLRDWQSRGMNCSARWVDGDDLIRDLLSGVTNSKRPCADRGATRSGGVLSLAQYTRWCQQLGDDLYRGIVDRWGDPAADPFFDEKIGGFALPVIVDGHVVIAIQPARGYNIDPQETYHSPDLLPPHGYVAFYLWLRHGFQAHAVVQYGKHGNLEWLPGKSLALSPDCSPLALIHGLPHVYPFIINDPGEGMQAKRRTAAVVIDHLMPPLTRAELYGPLLAIERELDEYTDARLVDPPRAALVYERLTHRLFSTGLARELGICDDGDPDTALDMLDNHLCAIKESVIRGGLHRFGAPIPPDRYPSSVLALARGTWYAGSMTGESILRAMAADLALDGQGFDPLAPPQTVPHVGPRPELLQRLAGHVAWRHRGHTLARLEDLALRVVCGDIDAQQVGSRTVSALWAIRDQIETRLSHSPVAERDNLAKALCGCFVPSGPSGAPTRGVMGVLPSGRNFFAGDMRGLPTPAAWDLGQRSALTILNRHRQDWGCWPRRLALSAWGTAAIRTGGDDIAQALAFLGVEPVWDEGGQRVRSVRVLSLEALGRPRVDVTLRVSGFFRDAFPHLMELFDVSVRLVSAQISESADDNPLRHRVISESEGLEQRGMSSQQARWLAASRLFGSKPGAYGAGLQALIDEGGWQSDDDLAQGYLSWSSYLYAGIEPDEQPLDSSKEAGLRGQVGVYGRPERDTLERCLSDLDVIVHNQDNREHDILDSDDYYQFAGGLAVSARSLGSSPAIYHGDHSRADYPVARTLSEEITRVVRSRVCNPKWIQAMMTHGYKGGMEMAATVNYLFAFQATARCVHDHHFDAVYESLVADDTVSGFLRQHNPEALRDIRRYLHEAIRRELWNPGINSVFADFEQESA